MSVLLLETPLVLKWSEDPSESHVENIEVPEDEFLSIALHEYITKGIELGGTPVEFGRPTAKATPFDPMAMSTKDAGSSAVTAHV